VTTALDAASKAHRCAVEARYGAKYAAPAVRRAHDAYVAACARAISRLTRATWERDGIVLVRGRAR
jgi:hypothetical protein